MNTFQELWETVQSDLTVGSESTLFPLTTVKSTVNRAYIKCGGLYRWPETEDAKKTSTQANIEYYDYPQTWRPDSIWKLTVDDTDYGDPIDFKDYLYEKEEDVPSGKDYMWANQWRRYFLYPTPTAVGDYNISVWGQRIVDALSNAGDVTIFSYSLPECNEAIVLEAVAILRSKGEQDKVAEFKSMEAKQLLTVAWNKIKQDKVLTIKTKPFFNVPDFFKGNGSQLKDEVIGNF